MTVMVAAWRAGWLLFAVVTGLAVAAATSAQPTATPTEQEARLSGGRPVIAPPAGLEPFQRACASCHTAEGLNMGGRIAMPLSSLRALPPERIYEAQTVGKMQAQAASLTDAQKKAVAVYLAGRPLIDAAGASVSRMTNRCKASPRMAASAAAWRGWGNGEGNARFQSAAGAGLAAKDVPKLRLKWAFGLPGGASSFSQPTVAGGRVFVGSDNATLYSIDARTGCAYWSFTADAAGRYAPVVASVPGSGARYAVMFATSRGTAYAVDAETGKQLWRTEIRNGRVSASAAYADGRLYVPLIGTETVAGSNPDYECCKSRGGVAALDAANGKLVWQVESLPEPLQPLGKNPKGVQLWGPSGASVWNTPTIDLARGVLYAGTGNSYGPKAGSTSDSILALRLSDGKIVWSHQEFADDAFMLGCGDVNPTGGNCPPSLGRDWDFGGASVIRQALADGRDILLAAGKGGVALGLDPAGGKVLWRTKLYDGEPPTADGLVIFGGAADGRAVYYPLQQPGGGLAALDIRDGRILWKAALKADGRGQIGAASAIPGAVFTGGWDGILRAVSTEGRVLWSFDTRRDFATVNGVPAKGGSLGSPGPVIAGGMVFVASGYIGMQNGSPGNVILAFAP